MAFNEEWVEREEKSFETSRIMQKAERKIAVTVGNFFL